MYNRNDPRIRRALNEFERTLESANETAQVGLFSFGQHYIRPCLGSVGRGFQTCIAPCFPTHDQRHRRKRTRSRGPESSFDFYDDWAAEDEGGNDEFERLLGESQDDGGDAQPGRHVTMSYGSTGRQRAKSAVVPYDGGPDPTVIPKSSYFGFLSKLPFQSGTKKGLRYKPSAADLKQVKRGGSRRAEVDIQEEEEEQDTGASRKPGRGRRNTASSENSGRTVDSYSSRGDIFPSDDEEYTDAVPLDDEFAMALERRSTGDDLSSGQRPRYSRNSTQSKSSLSIGRKSRPASTKSANSVLESRSESVPERVLTLQELAEEEQRLRTEEELDFVRRRDAARKLARERGLSGTNELSTVSRPFLCFPKAHFSLPTTDVNQAKSSSTISVASLTTYPFPSMDSETDSPQQARSGPSTEDRSRRSRTPSPSPSRTQTQNDKG